MGLPGRAENLPGWLCSEWGWRGANNNNRDNNNHLCVFELSSSLFSFIFVISFDPHNRPAGREGKPLTPTGPGGNEPRRKGDLPAAAGGDGASEVPVDGGESGPARGPSSGLHQTLALHGSLCPGAKGQAGFRSLVQFPNSLLSQRNTALVGMSVWLCRPRPPELDSPGPAHLPVPGSAPELQGGPVTSVLLNLAPPRTARGELIPRLTQVF